MTDLSDTICAIATAVVPQQGSVGIVRLSGTASLAIAQQVFRPAGKPLWESHRLLYGHFLNADSTFLDECLVLYMQAPRSFTAEDVIEFHCHGGIAIVQQVLRSCVAHGARLARPGEFSLRAFLNGRIDLTRAEAVAELVGARSPEAASLAMAALQGKLAKSVQRIRERCLGVLVELEVRIDFEDDLPPLDEASIRREIGAILAQVRELMATSQRGALLRTGLKIAIVGRPNVGKSSLLNAWSRTERAIVTDLPGTTRDVVESMLNVRGIPVQVLDTAGIRETDDTVERMGIARSRSAAREADLVLLVIDRTAGWTCEDSEIYMQVRERPLILVVNKSDADGPEIFSPSTGILARVETCATQAMGIDTLENAILAAVGADQVQASNSEFAVNERQFESLLRAESALAKVMETVETGMPLDFWTIDLRTAAAALGELTGETVSEAVLDRIFSKFCIGK
jgi:tRNA modification GTPase